MAQRSLWRGYLRLALVSCPVALYNARHDRSAIRFNLINPKTGNRIKMVTQDGGTGEELLRRDTIKGYEFKKDHYLILSEEDFDSVRVESSEIMTVEKFVEADSIDPMYYDASYFLAPDGEAGKDVYAVLREAIADTGKIALTRVVINQRERTVALRPMDGVGLMAHTLYEQRDLNNPKELFDGAEDVKVDPEMVTLAKQLVQRQVSRYDAADLEDRYETRLRAMIDAKLKGEGVEQDEPVVERSNVIDLMAALKKSLGQVPTADELPRPVKAKAKKEPERRQTGLKLPIEGGKKAAETPVEQPAQSAAQPVARGRRKAS